MMANTGEALELAMGLLRAPAHRSALRARPLPQGMGTLLAIASGSAEASRRAAQHTGYDEAELLEASRFYVQQVLLAEDADAYRVLGAERGAEHATLRDHHRHLLRWLHPDRSAPGTQWDSALAIRVNQAWNQLRTNAARTRYDATNPAAPRAGAATAATSPNPSSPSPSSPNPPVGAATAAISPNPGISPAPILVGLLGITCIVLAWLAFTREDTFDDVRSGESPEPVGAAMAAINAAPGEVAIAAIAAPTGESFVPVTSDRASPDTPAGAATAAIPTPPVPMGAAIAAIRIPPEPAAAATATIQTQPQPQPQPVGAAIAAMQIPPEPAAAATAAIHTQPQPAAAATAAIPTPPEPVGAAIAAISAAPGEVAVAAIAAPTRAVAPVVQVDPLQLFLEAEDAVRSVTAYLAADGAEPAWLDMPIGLEGAGIRTQLQARHANTARPRMQVDAPNWTLDAMAASMLGAYRLDGRRGTLETGMLRIELTRLDQAWRVTGLQLEPAR